MSALIVDGVSKSFGGVTAVKRISFSVPHGKRMVLLGPSGCGKTTTLRIIAGLERPDCGKITMDQRDWFDLSPAARNVAMVFQTPALYPHMRVAENLAFAMNGQRISRQETAQRIDEVARWMGITDLLDRFPGTLSGGQQSRAAFARAIVKQPTLLLLDEPLSGLDARLKWELQNEWLQWHRRFPITTLHVTHDQHEAMMMADLIAVMRDGEIVQTGTPQELYLHPANRFVAGFFGSPGMNFASAVVADGWLESGGIKFLKPDSAERCPSESSAGDLVLGVRPESICLESCSRIGGYAEKFESDDDQIVVPAKVLEVRSLGYQLLVEVLWQKNRWWVVKESGNEFEVGEDVKMRIRRKDITFYLE